MDAVVVNYAGRVDKHIGDCVMAVFGAPIAHSDDPERALRTASEIHDAMRDLSDKLGLDLRAHIGIATPVGAGAIHPISKTSLPLTSTSDGA